MAPLGCVIFLYWAVTSQTTIKSGMVVRWRKTFSMNTMTGRIRVSRSLASHPLTSPSVLGTCSQHVWTVIDQYTHP